MREPHLQAAEPERLKSDFGYWSWWALGDLRKPPGANTPSADRVRHGLNAARHGARSPTLREPA